MQIEKEITLDSFKLRLPIEKTKILDKSIYYNWILVNEGTGIIDEANFKNKSISYNFNGIKTKFALEKQITKDQSVQSFLIILINAKTLGKRYFAGIKKNNIKKVYEYVKSLNVADFSFNTFLNGEITDCDFKTDKHQKNFKEVILEFYSISKLSKDKNMGAKVFTKKNNLGIEFSDRRTTEIKSSPFVKLYSKEIELMKGPKDSQLFFKNYIYNIKFIDFYMRDLIRIEFTIKNKKHFKIYQIYDTTLKAILNLTEKKKREMLLDSLNKHLHFEVIHKKINKPKQHTPTDLAFLTMMELITQKYELPFVLLLQACDKNLETKDQKYRLNKKLTGLYNYIEIDKNTFAKVTDSTVDFLKWLLS